MQIAKILTADRVLTVTAYHARQKGWAMPENLYQWCAKSVAGILERRENKRRPTKTGRTSMFSGLL